MVRSAGLPVRRSLSLAIDCSAYGRLRALEADEARARAALADEAGRLARRASGDEVVALKRFGRRLRHRESLPDAAPASMAGGLEDLRARREAVEAAGARWAEAFTAGVERASEAVRALAADGWVREAVAWQNPDVVRWVLDPLAGPSGAAGERKPSRVRSDALVLASYVQRYATKNDTIGFFGPCAWARLTDAEGEAGATRFVPGPRVIASCEVGFEVWGLDEVGAAIAALPGLRPHLSPRRLPFSHLEGSRLQLPFGDEPADLPPLDAYVLGRCDGRTSARAIARGAVEAGLAGSPEQVFSFLEAAAEMRMVAWDLELPLVHAPERHLRAAVEAVGDPELREKALELVGRMEAARDTLAKARGDAGRVVESMERLDRAFTGITGQPARRAEGRTYGARTLAYLDCKRDLSATLGRAAWGAIGPALSLVLDSARWLTHEIARRYRAPMEALFDQLADGRPEIGMVAYQRAFAQSHELADPAGTPPVMVEARAELVRRWTEVLGIDAGVRRQSVRVEDVAGKAGEAFAAPRPGWTLARHLAPDLMVCARDASALARGECTWVLGELHALNTLQGSTVFYSHPDPDELARWISLDFPQPPVVPVPAKNLVTQRTFVAGAERAFRYEYSTEPSPAPRELALPIGSLLVERGPAGLRVRTRDGRHRFDLLDFFGAYLAFRAAGGAFSMAPGWPHLPRVELGPLVVLRERWRRPAREMTFPHHAGPFARYTAVRRWAEALGLPRFAFARLPTEEKPMFVDLESPLLVDLLVRHAKLGAERGGPDAAVTLTEMLPTPDEAWLPDAEGGRYTSELRLVAVDPDAP